MYEAEEIERGWFHHLAFGTIFFLRPCCARLKFQLGRIIWQPAPATGSILRWWSVRRLGEDFSILDNDVPPTSFEAVDGRQALTEMVIVIDAVNIESREAMFPKTCSRILASCVFSKPKSGGKKEKVNAA